MRWALLLLLVCGCLGGCSSKFTPDSHCSSLRTGEVCGSATACSDTFVQCVCLSPEQTWQCCSDVRPGCAKGMSARDGDPCCEGETCKFGCGDAGPGRFCTCGADFRYHCVDRSCP